MKRTACSSITSEYYNLTGSEKKIADYVLAHSVDVQFASITELAHAAGVSEASISRFCRRLEFGSFNAFKLELAKDATIGAKGEQDADGQTLPDQLMERSIDVIERTRKLLVPSDVEAAVAILRDARRVCCMGQGSCLMIAQEAWSLFSTVSSRFVCVQDSHYQSVTAALLDKRDAILYFSYSGATRAAVDVLPMAKKNGVKVVLVTRYRLSPVAQYADVTLLCGADESPMQLGSVDARISQLYLINVLFATLCGQEANRTGKNREKILKALNIKHL